MVATFRRLIDTDTAILARILLHAGADLVLAIWTIKAWRTFASVQPLTRIEAGSTILAGMMIGAIVQILIA